MGNTGNHKSKKCRRKIRIRLVDPNIPDSYVCELSDSSLENEEEISKIEPSPKIVKDFSKPKNYFELLMSKQNRKNGVVNSANGNDGNKTEEEQLKRKRQYNSRSRNSLNQLDGKKKKKYESDSSEDECLIEIKRRSKWKNVNAIEENQCNKNEIEEEMITDDDFITIFDSPKTYSTQKKKLDNLNYFLKSENKDSFKKLEEITPVINSMPICSSTAEKQNLIKTRNEKKLLNDINKENVKLAPLFCKKENKAIDSARQKARLDFLYKGSPLLHRKADNKSSENFSSFPTIAHVQQRNDSPCWSRRDICLPLPELPCLNEDTFSSTKKFNFEIRDLTVANSEVGFTVSRKPLNEVNCKYLELNLEGVIYGLKEKQDKFQARIKEIEKLGINQKENGEIGFEEMNILWTEKYKPKSCEILGNGTVVKKLKKWLQLWKSFDEELKILVKSNHTSKNKVESDDNDDDDNFVNFGCENYGLKTPGNVCIISGPNGCGKTALVHALANELEFKVLELNASSKRTGKKVLCDLQEATQSHKVHRENVLQAGLQKGTKKKKNKKKKKNSAKTLEQSKDCKISLILIEDADIVFDDHDEGFFPAIASLVQTSKRPLIFLTNDPNCHNLYGFKPEQCLILEMEMPSFDKSCAVLDVVSSLEGATFEKELIGSLLRYNNFDLRKSLLQLQFWVHSGRKPVFVREQFDLGHLWWGSSKFLFKQSIKYSIKPKSRKRKRVNDLFDSSDDEVETATKKLKTDSKNSEQMVVVNNDLICKKSDTSIESYFKVLDVASSLDCFNFPGSQEPIPEFECRVKDGLSLSENMEESFWVGKRLTEQVLHEMVSLSGRIFAGSLEESEERKLNFVAPCWEDIRWRDSQEKASQELSVLVSLQRGRDKRCLNLDYLPVLRNICRLERNRSELNPKRKNRFYHYLNTLGLELSDENVEINCDVFNQ